MDKSDISSQSALIAPQTARFSKVKGILTRFVVILAALAVVVASTYSATAQDEFPELIPLPDGFQPEGIAIGRGAEFYVGSIPTGAIFRGNLRTGEGEVFIGPQTGRAAIGLDFDDRSGYLFVAGGPTGHGYVYDGETGETVAHFAFTDPTGTFINDVYVTRHAAYFTNSARPEIYKVPLGPAGSLPDPGTFETIPLTGDFVQQPGFNANGITASPNGKWLIIVQSNTGYLFLVDAETGVADRIELAGGATVERGDGILLHGRTLYVVQNAFNQIAVVELSQDFTSGEVVDTITSPSFRVPTTIARFKSRLYVVNARFGTPPTSETDYEVVQVPRTSEE